MNLAKRLIIRAIILCVGIVFIFFIAGCGFVGDVSEVNKRMDELESRIEYLNKKVNGLEKNIERLTLNSEGSQEERRRGLERMFR